MTKQEFLSELESLLLDIPKEEREEALIYYENYFNDAGAGMEQSIIDQIGIPKKVAATIRSDLAGSQDMGKGEFTETGYKEPRFEHKYEIYNGGTDEKTNSTEQNNPNQTYQESNHSFNTTSFQNERNTDYVKIILIAILCLFGSPFIVAAFAVVFSIMVALVSFFFSFIIVAIVLFGVGIFLAVLGIIEIFSFPPVGIAIVGAGLLLNGIGLLFLTFSIWICSKILPALFRWIIDLCRKPFHKRRVTA